MYHFYFNLFFGVPGWEFSVSTSHSAIHPTNGNNKTFRINSKVTLFYSTANTDTGKCYSLKTVNKFSEVHKIEAGNKNTEASKRRHLI